MHTEIAALISAVAQPPSEDGLFNPYHGDSDFAAIRRANLGHYLSAMQARQPQTLLLMEAPGYRGCRLTGIPVTSRKVMLEGLPELRFFGTDQAYQDAQDPGFEAIYSEQSASIVWQTLVDLGALPLIWNACPWHPHQPGKALSNRKPRQPELRAGQIILQRVLDLYQAPHLIAVGRVAEASFAAMGLRCDAVRHPAQGGKADFVAGLTALLAQD